MQRQRQLSAERVRRISVSAARDVDAYSFQDNDQPLFSLALSHAPPPPSSVEGSGIAVVPRIPEPPRRGRVRSFSAHAGSQGTGTKEDRRLVFETLKEEDTNENNLVSGERDGGKDVSDNAAASAKSSALGNNNNNNNSSDGDRTPRDLEGQQGASSSSPSRTAASGKPMKQRPILAAIETSPFSGSPSEPPLSGGRKQLSSSSPLLKAMISPRNNNKHLHASPEQQQFMLAGGGAAAISASGGSPGTPPLAGTAFHHVHQQHHIGSSASTTTSEDQSSHSGRSAGAVAGGGGGFVRPPLFRQSSHESVITNSKLSNFGSQSAMTVDDEVECALAALQERQARVELQRDVWYSRAKEKISAHSLQQRLRMCQATARELDLVILQAHRKECENLALSVPEDISQAAAEKRRRSRARTGTTGDASERQRPSETGDSARFSFGNSQAPRKSRASRTTRASRSASTAASTRSSLVRGGGASPAAGREDHDDDGDNIRLTTTSAPGSSSPSLRPTSASATSMISGLNLSQTGGGAAAASVLSSSSSSSASVSAAGTGGGGASSAAVGAVGATASSGVGHGGHGNRHGRSVSFAPELEDDVLKIRHREPTMMDETTSSSASSVTPSASGGGGAKRLYIEGDNAHRGEEKRGILLNRGGYDSVSTDDIGTIGEGIQEEDDDEEGGGDGEEDEEGEDGKRQWWHWKRRDTEMTPEEKLERAAIYIDDARFKRPVRVHRTGLWPRKVLKFQTSVEWRAIIVAVTLLNSIIPIWTSFGGSIVPDVCAGEISTEVLETPHGNFYAVTVLEFLCMFMYLMDLLLCLYHEGRQQFVKQPSNLCYAVFFAIAAADVVAATVAQTEYPRIPRAAVAGLLIVNHPGTLRAFVTLIRIVPLLLQMVGCLIILIIVYTVIGVSIFSPILEKQGEQVELLYQNEGSFKNHGVAALSLFILVTTENYPNVMEGLYNYTNRWPTLFFISFIVCGTFIVMGVFTGIVFSAHKTEMKNAALQDRILERKALMAAFFTMVNKGQRALTFEQWQDVLHAVNPSISSEEVGLLFEAIDEDGSGTVDLLEFFELCDVLLLRFHRRSNWVDQLLIKLGIAQFVSRVRRRLPLAKLRRFFNSKYFGWYQLFSLTVYLVALIAAKEQDLSDAGDTNFCNEFGILKMILLGWFQLEVLIRLVAVGAVKFCRVNWNLADLFFVACGTVSLFVTAGIGCNGNNVAVAVLQAMVTLRLILSVDRFKELIMSLIHFSSLLPAVGGLVYALMFLYVNIGGELWCRCLFTMETGAPHPSDFTDFSSGMLTLFQVVTSSNWHQLMLHTMEKFNYSGRSQLDTFLFWFAMVYYITFYFLAVVILLNLVISVVIDAYVVEQELLNEEKHILLEATTAGKNVSNNAAGSHHEDEEEEDYDEDYDEDEEEDGQRRSGAPQGRKGAHRSSIASATHHSHSHDGAGDEQQQQRRPSARNRRLSSVGAGGTSIMSSSSEEDDEGLGPLEQGGSGGGGGAGRDGGLRRRKKKGGKSKKQKNKNGDLIDNIDNYDDDAETFDDGEDDDEMAMMDREQLEGDDGFIVITEKTNGGGGGSHSPTASSGRKMTRNGRNNALSPNGSSSSLLPRTTITSRNRDNSGGGGGGGVGGFSSAAAADDDKHSVASASSRVSVRIQRRYSRELARQGMSDQKMEEAELQMLQMYAPIDLMSVHKAKQEGNAGSNNSNNNNNNNNNGGGGGGGGTGNGNNQNSGNAGGGAAAGVSGRRLSAVNKFKSTAHGVIFSQRARNQSRIDREDKSNNNNNNLHSTHSSSNGNGNNNTGDVELTTLHSSSSSKEKERLGSLSGVEIVESPAEVIAVEDDPEPQISNGDIESA